MAGLYEEQILGAQQSKDLARKLRETEIPSTGHMIGDWYVAPTVAQQLSGLLKQGIGAYKENQAEDEIKGLKQERARSSVAAFSQMGVQAPSGLLAEAGTPAIKPSVMDRLKAYVTPGESQPKGTPAQPYQQTIAQNVTPTQSDAALLNLIGSNPELGAGALGIRNTRATSDLAASEKTYQHKLKADEAAAKVEAARLVAEAKVSADKDTNELRIQIAELGNAGKTTKSGWEMLKDPTTGMAIGRYNPETGAFEMLQGGAGGVAPPAKLTEDQGKAAGWLTQATNAYNNMLEAKIMKDKDGKPIIDPNTKRPKEHDISPTLLEAISPSGTGVENWARSAPRQLYAQGASSLSEALLRAATGAGVNENEAKQKVAELTPQYTDKPETRAQKEKAILLYIESLKQRAGAGAAGAAKVLTSQGIPSTFDVNPPPASNSAPIHPIEAELKKRRLIK